MSTSALELNRGRWHSGQFLMLMTRSIDGSGDPLDALDASSASDDEFDLRYGGVGDNPWAAASRGCCIGSVGWAGRAFGSWSAGSRSLASAAWFEGTPEKSSLSKSTFSWAWAPPMMAGVTGADVSMTLSSGSTRFFSLAGRHSSVSRHWIASSTVSTSSCGRLLKRVQKELTVSRESVEPRESSIDVSSR